MKVGDLVAFDDWLWHGATNFDTFKKRSEIVGVVIGKWEKTPEPIARPNETEIYWKIQIGDKTIHLEKHLFRKVS